MKYRINNNNIEIYDDDDKYVVLRLEQLGQLVGHILLDHRQLLETISKATGHLDIDNKD